MHKRSRDRPETIRSSAQIIKVCKAASAIVSALRCGMRKGLIVPSVSAIVREHLPAASPTRYRFVKSPCRRRQIVPASPFGPCALGQRAVGKKSSVGLGSQASTACGERLDELRWTARGSES